MLHNLYAGMAIAMYNYMKEITLNTYMTQQIKVMIRMCKTLKIDYITWIEKYSAAYRNKHSTKRSV
jgi:hypothetical protein